MMAGKTSVRVLLWMKSLAQTAKTWRALKAFETTKMFSDSKSNFRGCHTWWIRGNRVSLKIEKIFLGKSRSGLFYISFGYLYFFIFYYSILYMTTWIKPTTSWLYWVVCLNHLTLHLAGGSQPFLNCVSLTEHKFFLHKPNKHNYHCKPPFN